VHYDSRLSSYALDDDALDNEPRRESNITSASDVPLHRIAIERTLAAEVASLPAHAKAMLFSHERLMSLRAHEVERVVGLLRRLFSSIRVVAYIRRQDEFIMSLWGQRLKTRPPGPTFWKDMLRNRRYLHMLDTWERAVGRANLVVRLFDTKAFVNGDLQADFRHAAGIPSDDRFARPIRTNESLDADAQRLLLDLGHHMAPQRGYVARLLMRVWKNVAPDRGLPTPPPIPPSLTQFLMRHKTGKGFLPGRPWAMQVMAACAEENETLRRRYFPERRSLFNLDFSRYPATGGAPGVGATPCDPSVFQNPKTTPAEPDAIAEAYRLVMGRPPTSAEVELARRESSNIAQLYASLLARARVSSCAA
jgi:hypothetical protein